MSVEEIRARLLGAARTLLLERGLQATPMSLISKTAKVPVCSIYHLFESKEALVNEIYVDSRGTADARRIYAGGGRRRSTGRFL